MTVKECYEKMGANYEEVFSRLRTDERIEKFLNKVLADGSYALLCDSLAKRDMPEAFRAAHTLKGVCMNLSLTKLYASSEKLTENLRGREEYGDDIKPMLDAVSADYELTMNAIKELANK